ncbi:MAG: peptidylprolyl isomerase [Flavobacteriales bacterium]
MKIQKGSNVEVSYVLRVDSYDGEVVEETMANEPMAFVYGEDQMLEKFEQALLGLSAGDKFEVAIPVEEAYGPELDELYVEFPKSEFIEDGEIDEELFEIGEIVPMQTPDGDTVQGMVAEVHLNSIVLDFNHPLAGEDLYFRGEVLTVA